MSTITSWNTFKVLYVVLEKGKKTYLFPRIKMAQNCNSRNTQNKVIFYVYFNYVDIKLNLVYLKFGLIFLKCRWTGKSEVNLNKYVERLCLEFFNLFVFSAGGIELTAQHGKMKINNTLESRLDMISQQVRNVKI